MSLPPTPSLGINIARYSHVGPCSALPRGSIRYIPRSRGDKYGCRALTDLAVTEGICLVNVMSWRDTEREHRSSDSQGIRE